MNRKTDDTPTTPGAEAPIAAPQTPPAGVPAGAPEGGHEGRAGLLGAVALVLPDRRDLAAMAWALAGLTLLMVLVYAHPAYAQDVDTCAEGGGIGGEGGQQILEFLRNIVAFVALTIGSLTMLGILSSGAMLAGGAVSKDWQRRGLHGLGYSGIGGAVTLLAAAGYGVLRAAACGG